ncbi:MAG: hypothetical protein SLAVMIC_00079 [uncultured marine phage]|uniref:Uncharacterized protein n=1 Tax=uncultured marine phage TaxID=707152 RepID=A0A8D9C9D1_9VIRU|nr:MAG: hypothetical protein SLAVMIC_00079 [uncultured marine phage]
MARQEEPVRFSINEVIKQKFGEGEKNTKTAASTKRAKRKVTKKGGKYKTKTVGGVKYMVLNDKL